MKEKRIVFLGCFVILGVLFWAGLASQVAEKEEIVQIETYLSQDKVRPGDTFKVAFNLKIAPGWHVNGNELDDEFLIPTWLGLDDDENLEVLDYYYPEARSAKFDYSESELMVYEGEVVLGALVTAKSAMALGSHDLTGKLLYQTCDHSSCLPPKNVDLKISFEVIPTSEEIAQTHPEIFSKMEFKDRK